MVMFVVFLIIFLMTIVGNSLIILAVRVNIQLQTPMYFFLSNLSVLEMFYTSITIPNILSLIARGTNVISFTGCIIQVYLFTLCATTECILLACMACDRYVAICRPLHYTVIINREVCLCLAALAWLSGILNSTINTVVTSGLWFCGSNSIERLYCEVQPLIHLSCSDTHTSHILATLSAAVFGVSCLIFILISYTFILVAIFRIPSRYSRQKTFSTCASHVTVVVLYFGSLIFMYLLPNNSSSEKLNSAISMIYSTITPMLNPIIYSLRNHQVLGALKCLRELLYKNMQHITV
ncbi:PREDICTED: olfactory receptor 15-like [Nanorana parkeri]|uniref:olfactory receptor 15-like n=1 Tax=Nanorana parkeri TaxID=125878 RepID=UPI0008549FC8|nr:PREDICTED: olfactory receptor 15-like [Nanorana parkeri]